MISLQVLQTGEIQNLKELAKELPSMVSSDMERILQKAIEDQTIELKEHISASNKELLEEIQQSIAMQNTDSEKRLIRFLCPYITKVHYTKTFWREYQIKNELTFDEFFRGFHRLFLRKFDLNEEKTQLIKLALKSYFKETNIHHIEINCFFSSIWANKDSRKELIKYDSVIPDLKTTKYKLFFRALSGSVTGGSIKKGHLIEIDQEIHRGNLNDREISKSTLILVKYDRPTRYTILDNGSHNKLMVLVQLPYQIYKGLHFELEINNTIFQYEIEDVTYPGGIDDESEETIEVRSMNIHSLVLRNLKNNIEYRINDTNHFEIYEENKVKLMPTKTYQTVFSMVLKENRWTLHPARNILDTPKEGPLDIISVASPASNLWIRTSYEGQQHGFPLRSWTILRIGTLKFQIEFQGNNY